MKKTMKKLLPLLLAVVMCLAFAGAALAQDVTANPADSDNAIITITNAAKGETYTVVKLFDATVTGTDGGSIAYQGEIPSDLTTYFTKDTTTGEITATSAAMNGDKLSDNAQAALKAWATQQSATAAATSDGSTLNFKGLPYGYYVVLTTQGAQAITVTSTNPSASIVDKNTTTPTGLVKDVDNDNVHIGDTVTYTVRFKTANYDGQGEQAKQIVSYTIEDTLPAFLSNVQVTGIYVDNDGKIAGDEGATTNDQTSLNVQQFNDDKKITIPWVDNSNNSLYKNGAYVVITYTATVTDTAAIDGTGNTNTVKMTWKDKGDNTDHGEDEASETIYTYALALKKVNEEGAPLGGATFQFPFYVKKDPAADGAYIYAFANLPSTFAEGDSAENYTNTITTPATDGVILVKGLKSDEAVSISETKAPDGYNKLGAPVSVTPVKTGETTTQKSWKIENGQIVPDSTYISTSTVIYENTGMSATAVAVLNKTGSTLPSTGGIGTTIFYIAGSALVLVAGAALFARRVARKQS